MELLNLSYNLLLVLFEVIQPSNKFTWNFTVKPKIYPKYEQNTHSVMEFLMHHPGTNDTDHIFESSMK